MVAKLVAMTAVRACLWVVRKAVSMASTLVHARVVSWADQSVSSAATWAAVKAVLKDLQSVL
jgi:hypothetical protein